MSDKTKPREGIGKYFLYLTVFVTGAVVLALEILGTRIIAPYYGTTVYVWSSLIAVTLLALSVGYFLGGWIADKTAKATILYVIILSTGLLVLLIPVVKDTVLVETNDLGPRFGALASAALLFALPLMLLGTIAPYAIKLKTKKLGSVGVTSGRLYGVATIGSCFGAIITGFYLIPSTGINSIVYLSGGLLLLLSLSWFLLNRRKMPLLGGVAVLLLVASAASMTPEPTLEEGMMVVYETESPYSRLKVIDEDGESRHLILNGAMQSIYNLEYDRFKFAYLKLLKKAVDYHPSPKDVLVVGLGGGGIDKTMQDYDLNIDNVEVDPEVAEIARDYFGFTGSVTIDDGRHYLRNTDKNYDIIFLDVYGTYATYPYIYSREAFGEIKNILNEDGILAINVIGYETGRHESSDPLIQSIHKTLGQVFENTYVKSTGTGLTNIVFYASDNHLELDDELVTLTVLASEETPTLTDDYNPIEVFSIKAAEETRRYAVNGFGNAVL